MAGPIAVLDACVLFPAPLRDLLLRLALFDLFRPRWTDEIHAEWIAGVLRRRSDLTRMQLDRTRQLMDAAVTGCLVHGHRRLAEQLTLPDLGDRHVLAAAIRCRAEVIVTFNLKHFPPDTLRTYGIEAQHPDQLVCRLFEQSPGAVCAAVRQQRLALTRPPKSVEDLLGTFMTLGLAGTVANLEVMWELL